MSNHVFYVRFWHDSEGIEAESDDVQLPYPQIKET